MLNKQNLSQQEFSALQILLKKKNKKYSINDSDKNLGAAAAEKKRCYYGMQKTVVWHNYILKTFNGRSWNFNC